MDPGAGDCGPDFIFADRNELMDDMREEIGPAGTEAGSPDKAVPETDGEASCTPAPAPRTTFRMELSFDGTAYHGWQLQDNAVTVQQKVNAAVNSVLHEGVNVSGCSRTDTGVHANCFCCNDV